MSKCRYCPNRTKLARHLGISYRTLITDYWKRPGRPQNHSEGSSKFDIQAYKDWIAAFKSSATFGSAQNENGNELWPVSERERALIDKKRIEIERDKYKFGIEQREYIKRTEVNQAISTQNALVRRELYKAFEHDLPPRVEGLSALEIKKANKRRLDDIMRGLPRLFMNNEGRIETNGNGSAIR